MFLKRHEGLKHLVLLFCAVTVIACNDEDSVCGDQEECGESPSAAVQDAGGGKGPSDVTGDSGGAKPVAPQAGEPTASTLPTPVTALTRKVGDWYKPMLLFNDGWALLQVVGTAVQSPVANRKLEPNRWTQWRRQGDAYEYKSTSGSWIDLGDDDGYPALPKGYTFDAAYGALSVTTSGDSTIINSKSLVLAKDSKFVLSSSSRSTYNDTHDLIISASSPPASRGTYAVDGYLLTLTFDDGHIEKRGLVSGGGDEWMLWVENTVYCHQTTHGNSCTSKYP